MSLQTTAPSTTEGITIEAPPKTGVAELVADQAGIGTFPNLKL